MTPDLRLAWADWLETQPWTFFLTITFREPVPAHRADSVLNAIGMQLCVTHMPETLFLGAERHLSTAMHFHGLYRDTVPREMPKWWWKFRAKEIWQTLYETYGRSSVELIRSKAEVSTYVSKYCTKELGSYGFYGRPEWEPGLLAGRGKLRGVV